MIIVVLHHPFHHTRLHHPFPSAVSFAFSIACTALALIYFVHLDQQGCHRHRHSCPLLLHLLLILPFLPFLLGLPFTPFITIQVTITNRATVHTTIIFAVSLAAGATIVVVTSYKPTTYYYYITGFHLAARSTRFTFDCIVIVALRYLPFVLFWEVQFFQLFLVAFFIDPILLSFLGFCLGYKLTCLHLCHEKRAGCACDLYLCIQNQLQIKALVHSIVSFLVESNLQMSGSGYSLHRTCPVFVQSFHALNAIFPLLLQFISNLYMQFQPKLVCELLFFFLLLL